MSSRKTLSPKVYWGVLKDADPTFLGRELLQLLQWQSTQRQSFYSGGWYFRHLHRAWQKELAHCYEQKTLPTRGGDPTPMKDLLSTAMNVQG